MTNNVLQGVDFTAFISEPLRKLGGFDRVRLALLLRQIHSRTVIGSNVKVALGRSNPGVSQGALSQM